MGKGLHKVFKTVVNDILQELRHLRKSGSPFITEPRNFAEVAKFSDDIKQPWLKATMKEIKNIINNNNFFIEDPEKYEPVTPCMDVYKAKIKSDGNLDRPKLRFVVKGDMKKRNWLEILGYQQPP